MMTIKNAFVLLVVLAITVSAQPLLAASKGAMVISSLGGFAIERRIGQEHVSLHAQTNYQSKVITDTLYSNVLNVKRAYTVYLPKSFEQNKEKRILFFIYCMVCGRRMIYGRIVGM